MRAWQRRKRRFPSIQRLTAQERAQVDDLVPIVEEMAKGERFLMEVCPELYTREIIRRTGWRPRRVTGVVFLMSRGASAVVAQAAIARVAFPL